MGERPAVVIFFCGWLGLIFLKLYGWVVCVRLNQILLEVGLAENPVLQVTIITFVII